MDLRSFRPRKAMMEAEKHTSRSLVLLTCFMGFFLASFWLISHQIPSNTNNDSEVRQIPLPLNRVRISDLGNKFSEKEEKLLRIRGTGMEGESVESLRTRLDCFSESGRWVYNSTPRLLPWNAAGDQYASQCDGRYSVVPGNAVGEWADIIASHGGNWTVREELKWVWKTSDKCPLIPVDRDDLCRLIGMKGNVLVVGDSINHLLQWSLINNLLRNRSDPHVVIDSSDCRSCPSFQVCGDVLEKGFKIGFVRNDRISPITNISNDMVKNFLEWPWIHLLQEWDVQLLFLNRGAHYEPDHIYADSLRRTFSLLHALHPDLLVVFRNTPPGHVNCTSYRGPIPHRQHIMAEEDKFHWSEFERQNALAKKIVEEYDYIYMDVDEMLSRRPDGHINEKDCLHYCIPGPLDSVIQLFYNILRILHATK